MLFAKMVPYNYAAVEWVSNNYNLSTGLSLGGEYTCGFRVADGEPGGAVDSHDVRGHWSFRMERPDPWAVGCLRTAHHDPIHLVV